MRLRQVVSAVLAVAALTLSVSAEGYTIKYNVETETAPVLNPHKGWVQYANNEWEFNSDEYGIKNNPTWAFTSTVYTRFYWKNLETAEGVYDWTAIDKMIELCSENGKTFAFGICPADSGANDRNGLVPQYVYDKGCGYVDAKTFSFYSEDGVQRTPVWDDKHYLEAAYNLAAALAERYDGNENVEYIDVRTFGNWGEWHTYGLTGSVMPSVELQKQCLDKWAELFDETTLVLPINEDKPTEISRYAVSLGIALRRDGLIGIENQEKGLLTANAAGLPGVGEMCYGYGYMADNGTWTDDKLIKSIVDGKITYMALASGLSDGLRLYNESNDTVIAMQNKIGYCFEVKTASLKVSGNKSTLTVRIKNTGVAPQYFPLYLKIAFKDSDGEIIKLSKVKFLIKSGGIAAGKTKTFKYTFTNTKIPADSNICLGLFENEEGLLPEVSFCNKNVDEENYLVLGKCAKQSINP